MAAEDLTDDERARMAAQKVQLEDIKRRIDAELRSARPDRYEPGAPWLDDVAGAISQFVPATLARELLARDLVGQIEGQATRRGNRFLKTVIGVDGQPALPLDWYLYEDDPVAINVPVIEDGEVTGYKRLRVALRAMKARDWLHFSTVGRVDAQHRLDAELAMYDGADWIAAQQGADAFAVWAAKVCPIPKTEVA